MKNKRPLIVGAVADLTSLKADSKDCDFIELRIDSVGTDDTILNYVIKCTKPLLITARGSEEGGQNSLSIEERRQAYLKLMPYASAIDIEMRSHPELADVIIEAKKQGIVVVGSFHNFEKTPSLDELESKIGTSADLHKFATFIQSEKDLETHQALLKKDTPLSVMGMGPLGAEARPEMMKLGSILNYGFLGETATAPNQWPVAKLRAARDAE